MSMKYSITTSICLVIEYLIDLHNVLIELLIIDLSLEMILNRFDLVALLHFWDSFGYLKILFDIWSNLAIFFVNMIWLLREIARNQPLNISLYGNDSFGCFRRSSKFSARFCPVYEYFGNPSAIFLFLFRLLIFFCGTCPPPPLFPSILLLAILRDSLRFLAPSFWISKKSTPSHLGRSLTPLPRNCSDSFVRFRPQTEGKKKRIRPRFIAILFEICCDSSAAYL